MYIAFIDNILDKSPVCFGLCCTCRDVGLPAPWYDGTSNKTYIVLVIIENYMCAKMYHRYI